MFVDDKNWGGEKLKLGTRWDKTEDRMVWRKEWEEEDSKKEEPGDKRTLRILREMANSLEKDIRMKEDVGSNYEDKKLPTLDVKMWVEEKEGGGEK